MRALYFSKKTKRVDYKISDIKKSSKLTWVDIAAPSKEQLDYVAKIFGIHELAQEDVFLPQKTPKFVRYDDHAFIIAHVPNHLDSPQLTRKVCLYLGEKFLITTHRGALPVMDEVFDRVYRNPLLLDKGLDFVICVILQALFENYMTTVDKLSTTRSEVTLLKKKVAYFGRMASLQEKTLEPLLLSKFVSSKNEPYFRNLVDYMVRIGSQIEMIREEIKDVIAEHRAEKDQELNRIMKIMTIISTIFLPLNLVAGVYGMNVVWVPGQGNPWLFWYLMGGMLSLSLALLAFFRARGWL
jgi:magnesium transporter